MALANTKYCIRRVGGCEKFYLLSERSNIVLSQIMYAYLLDILYQLNEAAPLDSVRPMSELSDSLTPNFL